MKGYILTYKPRDRKSLTLLNQKVFGRLSSKVYMGKKYIYYVKGMLHNTKFYKILDGKYFIIDNKCIDTSILEKLCLSYELYEEERNLDESNLKTGEEHWFAIADEKGVIINGRNK